MLNQKSTYALEFSQAYQAWIICGPARAAPLLQDAAILASTRLLDFSRAPTVLSFLLPPPLPSHPTATRTSLRSRSCRHRQEPRTQREDGEDGEKTLTVQDAVEKIVT
jgi:hypothetical protein